MSILKKNYNFMPSTYITEVNGNKIVMNNNTTKINKNQIKEYGCHFRYRPLIDTKINKTSKNNFNIYYVQLSYNF